MRVFKMTTINNNYSNSQTQVPKQNPNAYAQKYADEKGISLEEAKAELKAKYGDPKQGTKIPNIQNTSSEDNYVSTENLFDLDDDVTNVTLTDTIKNDSKSLLKYIIDLFKSNNSDETEENKEPDPDEIAQEYADLKGISLEEAKAELKEIDEPQKSSSKNNQ